MISNYSMEFCLVVMTCNAIRPISHFMDHHFALINCQLVCTREVRTRCHRFVKQISACLLKTFSKTLRYDIEFCHWDFGIFRIWVFLLCAPIRSLMLCFRFDVNWSEYFFVKLKTLWIENNVLQNVHELYGHNITKQSPH